MARTRVPKNIETSVLVKSRRRCCLCFGLLGDMDLKNGQIAHLDRKNDNNNEDNLAFLCFEHHDEYDSITSQRKNFTIDEAKAYRSKLYDSLPDALSQSVNFGRLSMPPADPYAGTYVRIGSDEQSAEINLIPLPNGDDGEIRYFIRGEAYYGASREFGPNIGTLDFVGIIQEDQYIEFVRDTSRAAEQATTTLSFVDEEFINVHENNTQGQYGMNVTFQGTYRRVR